MTQLDPIESVTMADHLIAIRRRRWWVIVFSIAGALLGILGLRSSTSEIHVVAVAIPYKWVADPSDPAQRELVRPSDEGKAAADRRDELVPQLKHANITVEGQDESHRVIFTAAADSQASATRSATTFAEAFTADRLALLNKHFDDEIAVEEDSLTNLESRLNGTSARSTAQDAAVTLEIIDRTRRLAFLTHARGPEPMIGSPEVVRAATTSLGATSALLPLLGALVGGIFGATLAAAAGRLDRRLYSRADLERTIDGIPVLAVAGTGGESTPYLPAAGSLVAQFDRADATIGIFGVGDVTLAPVAAEALHKGLELVASSSNRPVPTVRSVMTSPSDESMGLIDSRDLDGVVVMSHFRKSTDAQLVEAVSSLLLIGAKVVGLILVGVPAQELEAARVSNKR